MFPKRQTGPLVVFIHVPKTAGTTVNTHLAAWAGGQDHIEKFRDKPVRLKSKADRLHWISGHLALNQMQALLGSATKRPLTIYGLMRDPVAQIASQYNWLLEIRHRGGRFFRGHPQPIRDLSDHLWASDNADPGVVIQNICARPGLFLNLQARFLLGDDLKFSEDTGVARLRSYSCLSTNPDQVVSAITGAQPQQARQENASPYHIDRSVFEADEMQAFLQKRHRFDLRLFARVQRERAAVKGS